MEGSSTEQILKQFPLTASQLQAAMDLIRDNRDYVAEGRRKIGERNSRGNPPEIEAKPKQATARMRRWLPERRGVLR